jgi:Fe-S cluster biogenesis protein NfuA
MFIQTEETPNPATLKFIPGRPVMGSGSVDFVGAEEAQRSPLAARLFEIPAVSRVFFGGDFITVTKTAGEWHHLKPAVLGAIMEHFTSGQPLFLDDEGEAARPAGGALGQVEFDDADREVVEQIHELIETRVRPAVAQDGGDITLQGFDKGVVFLHMQGSCAGCPSSTITLKNGIENMLRHYIPEVTEVRQVY